MKKTMKKTLALILSLIMVFSCFTGIITVVQAEGNAIKAGDINGDGNVNSKDLTRLMKYISGGSDTLFVTATQPFTPEKYSLLEMLVPYVAVAVGEGMRLADIGDEQERLEEIRRASAVYLAEHKRENLLKRVSVSTAMSMRPYIDRVLNELRALKTASPDDVERKLEYVTELTEKLDDLNVILERWIKMRRGELPLQIESFALDGIFEIIEKRNRQT